MMLIGGTRSGRGRDAREGAAQGALCVLQRQGDTCSVLVADTAGEVVRVLDARRVRTPDASAVLATLREQFGVRRVLRVVPGARSVCRCVELPGGSAAELAGAVALLAEAQLPESLPAHRRAGGVTPGQGAKRTAVLTGWQPGGATGPDAGALTEGKHALPESWICPVSAIAFLRGLSTTTGREEPPGIAYLDGTDGSISLAGSGEGKATVRVAIEDNSSSSAWREGVEAALGESAPLAPPHTQAMLVIEPGAVSALRERAEGVPGDAGWWNEHGVCLGAALVALMGDEAARPLAALLAVEPAVREPVAMRAASWLARGNNAWIVACAGVIAALLLPLALAWARVAIVEGKGARLKAEQQNRVILDRRAAIYHQLELTRWPMTKLLATVSAAAPEGVVAGNLRLSTDQGMAFQGTAKSQAQVNDLQANLYKTQRFKEVTINRVEAKPEGGVTFDLSAEILNPHDKFVVLEDYAVKPLAVRMYGEGASNLQETAPAGEKGRADRITRRGRGADAADASLPKDEDTRRPSASSDELPASVTDADIAKMEKSAVMSGMTKRKKYINTHPSLDRATKQRLEEEASKMKDRLQELNIKGAASGGAK